MAKKALEATRDFEGNFDPKAYRDTITLKDSKEFPTEWEFFFESAENVFKNNPTVRGTTMLELGSGPVLHNIVPAVFHFTHIVQSDLVSRNREALKKWLRNDNDALDWREMLTLAVKTHGYKNIEIGLKEVEELLRKNVKAVIKSDVLADQVVPSAYNVLYDLVMAPLLLEAAAPDYDTFKKCLRKINALVKISGHLILKGYLMGANWLAGNGQWFLHLQLKSDEIQQALKEAGFEECQWQILKKTSVCYYPFDAVYCVCCTKVRECDV